MISQKIAEIRSKIAVICIACGYNLADIKVVAVTKYTTVEHANEALQSGICDLGENRVQDAKEKFAALEAQGVRFTKHMIGHLQTNKVKDAVKLFDMIQSVDSVKVAEEIDKQAAKINKIMDVLVQVNSSHEDQKSGVAPDQAIKLLEEISPLAHVRVLGLMTIGLLTDEKEKVAECFELTKDLFDQAKEKFKGNARIEMKYLSMGMTQDYELAIACGANMVRIGSAIFA
jgi:hypothetical protein